MKTNLKLQSILIALLLLLILINSCRQIHVVDSKAEIVSRTIDATLNDSVLIYGYVYVAESVVEVNYMPEPDASIWVEGTDLRTNSDIFGQFSLKVLPGTYTIKCLGPYSDPRFTAYLKGISLSPNEKIKLQFYIGYIAE